MSVKFLGIDYGEKRIGLAIAEGGYGDAQAAATLSSLDDVIAYIHDNGPFENIVMGLPRNIEGEDTAQTHLVREAAGELSDKIGIEIELVDEFDTSNLARQRLLNAGKSFTQDQIDATAAALILEDYLTGLD